MYELRHIISMKQNKNLQESLFDISLALASLEVINADFLAEIKATQTGLSISPEKPSPHSLRIPAEDEVVFPLLANENRTDLGETTTWQTSNASSRL